MSLWDFLLQPEAIVAGAIWSTISIAIFCLSLLVVAWWQGPTHCRKLDGGEK